MFTAEGGVALRAGSNGCCGTDAVRILPNLNVGMGTNNPTHKLHVIGNIWASGSVTQMSDSTLKHNVDRVYNAPRHCRKPKWRLLRLEGTRRLT